MLLGHVYAAQEAFQRLAKHRYAPKTAYRLLKYIHQYSSEVEIIEQQRVKMVLEALGAEPGTDRTLEPETPEYRVFAEKFATFLEGPTDLAVSDLTLEAVVSALAAGDQLSVEDLARLEPFFTPDPPTHVS